ncbi:hypothetical protein PINS_up005884 [Pythium insidiosum]|nr:hypothetical protein PINS_up005884 [Pythium insidiosum]
MAVVVRLQLTVHFRIEWPAKLKQQALDATPKRVLPEDDVVVVTMGARALAPCDGKRLFLQSDDAVDGNNQVETDTTESHDGRARVRVDLVSGAACRPYADTPLYVPPDHVLARRRHGRHDAAATNASFAFVELQLAVDAGDERVKVDDGATAVETKKKEKEQETPVAAEHWAKRILQKADANSVLAKTLDALALTPSTAPTIKPASPQKSSSPRRAASPVKSTAVTPPLALPLAGHSAAKKTRPSNSELLPPSSSSTSSTTALSRASKALLMRHGFLEAHDTTVSKASDRDPQAKTATRPLDLHKELSDSYQAHEIRFHFAALRVATDSAFPSSRVYFTFQFYRFAPTRTERLRLRDAFETTTSSRASRMLLLMRESPANRPSLAIQFDVDTTATLDPLEPRRFLEYLLHKSLVVDVWDADSLLPLGSASLPLRELLRQGSGVKKFQGEVDIVESTYDASVGVSSSSSSSSDDYVPCFDVESETTAAISTTRRVVVGKLQFLMSNYGLKGKNAVAMQRKPTSESAGALTRAKAELAASSSLLPPPTKPKHRVRARPLVDSNAELRRLLTEHGLYGRERRDGVRADDAATRQRQRLHGARGSSDAVSLTPREVEILCERFRARQDATSRSTRIACDREAKKGLTALLSLKTPPMTGHAAAPSANATAQTVGASKPSSTVERRVSQATLMLSERLKRVLRAAVAQSGVALEKAFALFDANQDGVLCCEELVAAMRSLGAVFAGVSDDELREIVHCVDRDGDGRVDLHEFLAFVRQQGGDSNDQGDAKEDALLRWRDHLQPVLRRAMDKGVALHQVFQQLDTSGDGLLSYDEMASALEALGVSREQQQASHGAMQALLAELDADRDGSISYDEFLQYLGISAAQHKREAVASTMSDMEAALRVVFQRLDAKGIALDDLFDHFDTDKSGQLDMNECVAALQQCLQSEISMESSENSLNALKALERDALVALIRHINKNGDDVIDYREFLALCGVSTPRGGDSASRHPRSKAEKKLIKLLLRALTVGMSSDEIFRQLDANGDGDISVREFETSLQELFDTKDCLTRDDVQQISKRFDADGDGKISRAEFRQFMSGIQTAQTQLTTRLTAFTDVFRGLDGEMIPRAQWHSLCTRKLGIKNVREVTQVARNARARGRQGTRRRTRGARVDHDATTIYSDCGDQPDIQADRRVSTAGAAGQGNRAGRGRHAELRAL